jgi:hypothetical protein
MSAARTACNRRTNRPPGTAGSLSEDTLNFFRHIPSKSSDNVPDGATTVHELAIERSLVKTDVN